MKIQINCEKDNSNLTLWWIWIKEELVEFISEYDDELFRKVSWRCTYNTRPVDLYFYWNTFPFSSYYIKFYFYLYIQILNSLFLPRFYFTMHCSRSACQLLLNILSMWVKTDVEVYRMILVLELYSFMLTFFPIMTNIVSIIY